MTGIGSSATRMNACALMPAARVIGSPFAQLGDVGARGEDAARAGEDEDARDRLELGAQHVQRVDRRLVDRVAHRRAG